LQTATATVTPLPVQLSLSFDGPLQRKYGSKGTAALAGAIPVAIASRAWAPPVLRVLASGCISSAAVILRCVADGASVTSVPMAGAQNLSSVDVQVSGPGAVAVYPTLMTIRDDSGSSAGGCLSWPSQGAYFRVHDNRSWPVPAPASDIASSPASSFGGANASARAAAAAATSTGYARPAVEVVLVRCQLFDDLAAAAAAPVSGSAMGAARLLGEAAATVTLLQAAMPVPQDIMLYRAPRGALESMRTKLQEPVAGATGTVVGPSRLMGLLSAAGAQPAVDAVQAATMRLSARAAASPSMVSSAHAAPVAVSGSTTLVIALEPQAWARFPSAAQLRGQAAGNGSMAGSESAANVQASLATASALSSVSFPLALSVFVGGVRANISWVSADGSQVHAVHRRTLSCAAGLPLQLPARAGERGPVATNPSHLFMSKSSGRWQHGLAYSPTPTPLAGIGSACGWQLPQLTVLGCLAV
jgi:hypothetical protein